MKQTIPQRVIDTLRCGNHTIEDLCLAIYGTASQQDKAAMRIHVHRARLLTGIETVNIHAGAKMRDIPVVEYRLGE